MRKLISLFQRNYDGDRLVRNEVTLDAEWVQVSEGSPTRKWDGTACMTRDGKLYKRYDAKAGRTPPVAFEPAQEGADPITGRLLGWLPMGDAPEDRWHREAFAAAGDLLGGTYELVGPKVKGNSEQFDRDTLIPHGKEVLTDAPRNFTGLKAYLPAHDIEGIVWWRDLIDPNYDKVKLKKTSA